MSLLYPIIYLISYNRLIHITKTLSEKLLRLVGLSAPPISTISLDERRRREEGHGITAFQLPCGKRANAAQST